MSEQHPWRERWPHEAAALDLKAENDRLRSQLEGCEERLRDFADWVERDRHEPDKLLCHVQSMRSVALRTERDVG